MFRTYVPRAPLSAFVERFWLCTDAQVARSERILPSGTIELVLNLAEDAVRIDDRRFSGAAFSGTYARSFVIDATQHAAMLGVHFRPGGAFPFLGVPARELTDAHADLSFLWGPIGRELRERLCDAATVPERFGILETALLARLGRTPHAAALEGLAAFRRLRGGASIREVARATGLSQRRFIDVFRDAVGLTPKLFCRVLRFQHARQLTGGDWGEIAFAARYADQAHLIRDFREFASMTPAEYARRMSVDCMNNHVPL
ncbi:MAG TPA: helix-turn-helix domain-containing protein [Thermoanaerobaculia bacterium]